jgi:hypothetical protein
METRGEQMATIDEGIKIATTEGRKQRMSIGSAGRERGGGDCKGGLGGGVNHISGVTSVKLAANWWPSMGQNMILSPHHLDWAKRWFSQALVLG